MSSIATVHLPAPRGFQNPERITEREQMLLTEARVQPLVEWAEALVARRTAKNPDILVPRFDPADAGVEARVLVLLEAPGPMTNVGNHRPGSGFISVDNDDRTAETTWHARNEAGMHTGALHWNIVPWYLGAAGVQHPTAEEVGQGAMELRRLLPLLPDLRAVILAGNYAQNGWAKHVAPFVSDGPLVLDTWHPSPLAMTKPERREDLFRAFRRAASVAG